MRAQSLRSCPTLCDPMDCSPPGSSVHGILQSRILEWVVMPSSRGSSQPRYRTCVSRTVGRFFSTEPPGKPHDCSTNSRKWTLVHTMCANSFVIFYFTTASSYRIFYHHGDLPCLLVLTVKVKCERFLSL